MTRERYPSGATALRDSTERGGGVESGAAEPTAWLLDPALAVTVTSGRTLLLESGPTIHRIAHAAVVEVAEALFAGSGPEVTIPETLSARDQDVARQLMSAIENTGHAVRRTPEMDDLAPIGLFFEARRRAGGLLSFTEYRDLLRQASVRVVGTGGLSEAIRDELAGTGIDRPTSTGEQAARPADVIVYVADGEHARDVGAFNRARIDDETRTPWLLVQPFDGARAFVGPLIAPEVSACAECYRLRRLSNFPDGDVSQELEDAVTLAVGQVARASSLSHVFVVGMVAQVVLDFVLSGFDGPTSTPGFVRVLTNTATELSVTSHRVLRVPRCPECSAARGTGSPQIWFPVGVGGEVSQDA